MQSRKNRVEAQVRDQAWARVWGRIHGQDRIQVRDRVVSQVSNPVWDLIMLQAVETLAKCFDAR